MGDCGKEGPISGVRMKEGIARQGRMEGLAEKRWVPEEIAGVASEMAADLWRGTLHPPIQLHTVKPLLEQRGEEGKLQHWV